MKFDDVLESIINKPEIKQFISDNNLSDEAIFKSRNELIKYDTYNNLDYEKTLEVSRGRIYCYINKINKKFSEVNYKFESSVPYMDAPDKLITSDARNEVFGVMASILKENETRGFYLYGKPGTGKTTICKALAKKLYLKGRDVLFLKFPNLVNELKTKIPGGEYKYLMQKIMITDVVVLDDFSNEAFESNWIRDEVMFTILDYRVEHNLTTLFTSNFPFSEFEEANDNLIERMRLLERVRILGKYIELKDKRYRKY